MPDRLEPRLCLNPGGLDEAADARFVSECFGTPWSLAAYRWYLRRPFDGVAADRLVLMLGSSVAAGCGLAYRLLQTPDGSTHRVAVIVAAATLPAARGRGYYARLLQAAIERGGARDCVALLGFVTATNTTGRGLRSRGAVAIPSYYILARSGARPAAAPPLTVRRASGARRWRARAPFASRRIDAPAAVRFHYPDAQAWQSQFVERPHPVEPLRLGGTTRALVETVGRTQRLQWLDGAACERTAAIAAAAARASRTGHHFFMYSTAAADQAAARRLRLRVLPGYVMALASSARHERTVRGWGGLPWQVQSGDRL